MEIYGCYEGSREREVEIPEKVSMTKIVFVKGCRGGFQWRRKTRLRVDKLHCFHETHNSRQEWKHIKLILRKQSTVQPRMHYNHKHLEQPKQKKIKQSQEPLTSP